MMKTNDLVRLFVRDGLDQERVLAAIGENSTVSPDRKLTLQMLIWRGWFNAREIFFFRCLLEMDLENLRGMTELAPEMNGFKNRIEELYPDVVAKINGWLDQYEAEDPDIIMSDSYRERVRRLLMNLS